MLTVNCALRIWKFETYKPCAMLQRVTYRENVEIFRNVMLLKTFFP